MLKPGIKFPAFSLPDQNGETKNLSDFLGRPTVFFFYPKDLTSGCTTEACEFNEVLTTHQDFNVVGVSPDPAKMHIKFIAKHQLTYPLLSDEDKVLLTELGIWVENPCMAKNTWVSNEQLSQLMLKASSLTSGIKSNLRGTLPKLLRLSLHYQASLTFYLLRRPYFLRLPNELVTSYYGGQSHCSKAPKNA